MEKFSLVVFTGKDRHDLGTFESISETQPAIDHFKSVILNPITKIEWATVSDDCTK